MPQISLRNGKLIKLEHPGDIELQSKVDKLAMKALTYKQQHDKQREELIKQARELVAIIGRDQITNLDDNFVRKLYNYPSDITYNRLHTIFSKINVKQMKVEGIIERL